MKITLDKKSYLKKYEPETLAQNNKFIWQYANMNYTLKIFRKVNISLFGYNSSITSAILGDF